MKKITCLALFGRFPWPAIEGSCLALPSKTCFEELNSFLSLTTEQVYPFSFICLSKAVILFSRLSGSKLSPCSFQLDLKALEQFVVVGRLVKTFKAISKNIHKLPLGFMPRVDLIWH